MEKREDVLREALENNAAETARWQMYLQELQTTIENIDKFVQHLDVPVMVPIGRKAHMPGKLIHTNDVLVAHYEGYFSHCSAKDAKEICKLRIKRAEEQLKKLQTESELWTNKLVKPYVNGALPEEDQVEIIEEFDQEEHKEWMQNKHRESVKRYHQQKIMEDAQQLTANNTKADVAWEELELLEEMKQELAHYSNEEEAAKCMTAACLQQLMEQDKAAQLLNKNKIKESEVTQNCADKAAQQKQQAKDIHEKQEQQVQIEKKTELQSTANDATLILTNDDDDDDYLTEEVMIVKQTLQVMPKERHVSLLDNLLGLMNEKLRREKNSNASATVLAHTLDVIVELKDLWDEAQYSENNITFDMSDEEGTERAEALVDLMQTNANLRQKCISFAQNDETVEFRSNDTVAEMLTKRDIIKLDEPSSSINAAASLATIATIDKKQAMLQSVEAHYQQHAAANSNLLDQILPDMGKVLAIKEDSSVDDTAAAAVDLQPQTAENHNILKEVNHQATAYVSLQAEFSKPAPKSILRNKTAVQLEKHHALVEEPVEPKNKKKSAENNEPVLSAYNAVVRDVVEKPLVQPEALPEGKFIDANAPKKRVSRFRLSRAEIKST